MLMVVLGLVVRGDAVLLVKRSKKETGNNDAVLQWGFPGGKLEQGESNEDAVIREVHEETGFSVFVEGLISERLHPDFPVKAFYFACTCIKDEPEQVHDLGTSEVRWVRAQQVESYFTSALDPVVADFLTKLTKE